MATKVEDGSGAVPDPVPAAEEDHPGEVPLTIEDRLTALELRASQDQVNMGLFTEQNNFEHEALKSVQAAMAEDHKSEAKDLEEHVTNAMLKMMEDSENKMTGKRAVFEKRLDDRLNTWTVSFENIEKKIRDVEVTLEEGRNRGVASVWGTGGREEQLTEL